MGKAGVFGVLGFALAAAAWAAGEKPMSRDVTVATEGGSRTITGKDAETYRTTNAWLEARLKEAESVRVGSTYADVAKHFKTDGGISTLTKHRFVSVLCPFLKIDVEFEEKEGVKARAPLARTAKVVKVSRPYFEREFED